MLLDLLIAASQAAPGSRFARLLRRIDRALLLMAEADARAETVDKVRGAGESAAFSR